MEYKRRACFTEILRYAFGGLGSNVAYILCMSFLTYYMTDVFGVSAYAISGLMLLARMIDAFTDPLMGMIADSTRSKLGRYRPYLIFGAPVLGLTIYMLFASPNLSEAGRVFWAYLAYILYSLASTVCNIPYHSITPVMTDDPNQRTTVVTAKQAMTVPSSLFVSVLCLPLVSLFGDGQVGWRRYGLLTAVITVLSFWICAWGAKKKDTMDIVPQKTEKTPLKEQLKLIFANKPLLMLLIAFSTDQFAAAAASAVNVFYFQYYLGRKDLVSFAAMYTVAINLIMYFLIPVLSKKFGKKKLYMASTAAVIVPYAIMFFLPPSGVWAVIILSVIATGIATITGTLGWAMLPDCVEYGQWKLGIRGEGIISASLTFSNKIGMAVGGSITGLLLGVFGYIAGAQQTETVLMVMRVMKFIFPVLGYIASLISMHYYCITDEFFSGMMEDIRNGVSAENSRLKEGI